MIIIIIITEHTERERQERKKRKERGLGGWMAGAPLQGNNSLPPKMNGKILPFL
jgi:hypothetical protein